jgi:hypothetical protein
MKSMAPTLDDLLNDVRLARLFLSGDLPCALQLWILQIKVEQSTENRVVYGRLLPYSHSSDCWSASDRNSFDTFGQAQAQVVRLNLYIKSSRCAELLRQLSVGKNISLISEELKLELPDKLKARFGATTFATDGLVYRPVAYLLNRDAYDRRSPSSPHGGAGAFSASITQTDKKSLFRLGQEYDVALTTSVVNQLNADTGLDFGCADTTRFGDLELLVFPALDEQERSLLSVSWVDAPRALVARFNPIQLSHFRGFQFRLSIVNDSQIVHSSIAVAKHGADGVFECRFELSDELRARIDSTELEIFGFLDDDSRKGMLCCRWQVGYIRQLNFQGNVMGGGGMVKFDWLEKTTRPSERARVKAALTTNRDNLGFTNYVGGREADPWVPVNRDLLSLFTQLHPPKSEGRFFLRWGKSDGEGRLQFVEWFKSLLTKYHQHQIVIFDPYFETAGLGLVLLYATPSADCIVFTSLSKHLKEGDVTSDEPDDVTGDRINNLMASCEQNRKSLKRIKLRIYGLKEGRLHDRYILIIGQDRLPVAGFHLSNSFQKAAENYPLLVTPIPADTLLVVEKYKSEVVQEACAAQSGNGSQNPSMCLLFDSTASLAAPTSLRGHEPLRFLEMIQAGDVMSLWTGEQSLRGLSGEPLKEKMAALNLLKDGSLALPEEKDLRSYLDHYAGDFTDFTARWNVLGEVLAHSHTEGRYSEIKYQSGFLEFLTRFLEASFTRAHAEMDGEWAVVGAHFFSKPVGDLLHSSYHIESLFYPVKYPALTWPEFFAIKLLWRSSPEALLTIAEATMHDLPKGQPQSQDVVRLSLLSQIISEISLSIQFDLSEIQRELLIGSSNGLLRWLGLNAIERQMEGQEGAAAILQLISAFSHPQKVQVLGWMIQRAAQNLNKTRIYEDLVTALHSTLQPTITADELEQAVNSMRGHMRQLPWAEPWLFQDVISPLLQNNRASTDDACQIWIQELTTLLGPEPKHQTRLFELEREGRTTNISAYLLACSTHAQRQSCLKPIREILKKQQRILQQPLASTSNWARWNDALILSMWILAFTRWGQYYLRACSTTDHGLDDLSNDAAALATIRPMIEWQSQGAGKQGGLAAFLDQAEKLLAS